MEGVAGVGNWCHLIGLARVVRLSAARQAAEVHPITAAESLSGARSPDLWMTIFTGSWFSGLAADQFGQFEPHAFRAGQHVGGPFQRLDHR